MVNWQELGEVPDSEDDDVFDSQELAAVPDLAPTTTTTTTTAYQPDHENDNTQERGKKAAEDIWDVPDSQEYDPPILPRDVTTRRPTTTSRPVETLALESSPLSSPLSSLPSSPSFPARNNLDLPPVDFVSVPRNATLDFDSQVLNRNHQQPVGQDEISTSYVELSSPPQNLRADARDVPLLSLPDESDPVLLQSQELGQAADRQVAVRFERSLRPRKPIQEHPYLLENAQYSSLLRENGVRPLRMALEAERRRRQQASQDKDFEDDSQEVVQPELSDESQLNGLEEFLDGVDSLGVLSLSPSPLKTSPMMGRAGPSSQASSTGDTDGTSMAGEDLPALADLLKQRPRPLPQKVAKRKSSTPHSSMRKRKRHDIVDSDPLEPASIFRLVAGPSDSPAAQRNSRRSPERPVIEIIEPQSQRSLSPTPPQRPPGDRPTHQSTTPFVPRPLFIDSDSEDELARQDPASASEDGGSASEPESGSGSEMVHTVSRRIRGVLPASWLRLDQQAGRAKNQKDAHKRLADRSQEREQRRGVAQRRLVAPRDHTSTQLFFEDSDDDAPAPRQRTTDDVFHNQTRLVLQEDPDTMMPDSSFPEGAWSDDGASVVEDDRIDHMLPSKKRQMKLSESFRGNHRKPISAKPPRQPRITSMFNGSQALPSSAMELVKKNYRKPASKRKTKSGKGRRSQHTSRLVAPPPLSILDVIEPNAPRFLKIAARAANRRQDMGRSSPGKKVISLGTREDHVDALSVLSNWRGGSIPQRQSVSAARKQKKAKPRQPKTPLSETSPNIPTGQQRRPPTSATTRRLVKHTTNGGTISFRSDHASEVSSAKQRRRASGKLSRSGSGVARPAQLEMDETDQTGKFRFNATKRRLDRLYRKQREDFSNSSLLAFNETGTEAGYPASPPPEDNPVPLRIVKPQGVEQPKSRYRKKTKPQQVDVEAPQYSRANDPIPITTTPVPEPVQGGAESGKLQGLGQYGTQYTHHFEAFPLGPHVYFHESTLIGSGALENVFHNAYYQKILDLRPRSAFNLDGQTLRWGPWDAQVSSEMGVVLDFIAEQLECVPVVDTLSAPSPALNAAAFITKFALDSLSLVEPTSAKSFVCRVLEVFRGFDGRVNTLLGQSSSSTESRCSLIASVYDHLLITAFAVLKVCQNDASLVGEQFQIEDLVKDLAKTTVSSLLTIGLDQVMEICKHLLHERQFRERGLRADTPILHSWVAVMKVLEQARIPRTSFWDVTYSVMATPKLVTSLDAQDHEKLWKNMFTLLPLTEFNEKGMVVAGSRHDSSVDGWALPQKLLKKVFQLYKENVRQSPTFNNYCRALVGRCHYLVQQWGWRKCVAVVGVIFDFFGSQNLAHLRNEEVFKSPRFLEELGGNPSLAVEKEDRCFHIFLKLVALSIKKLSEVDSLNDIRNLIARTMPNHNRQHLKEQIIHERDLAALRNHHDLLCTLFWASPTELRPGAHLIERLVVPASSHKEACLINLRAWKQLANFIIASGEATTSFKPFAQWRNSFFKSIMHQFGSVASDMHQQFLLLSKDASNTISPEMVDAMVALNRAAIQDVVLFSTTASLDVMRHAGDLEAATFALNTLQLQYVFKHFSVCPPELNWSVLQASLATLEVFLSRVDDFKESEESQQSESQLLNSAQADDALLVVDHDLSSSFFSMARCVISAPGDKKLGAMSAIAKLQCTELAVTLSARLSVRFINGGVLRLCDMFKFGKYGLFEDVPVKLSLDQRKVLVLFIATLFKHGFEDFNDAGFTLSEVWTLALVKPRKYLAHENHLAQELQRQGKEFVPEAAIALATNLNYNSNRDMFEFAISWMRRCLGAAGPSRKKDILSEHSKTLKAVMQQIKRDLRTVAQEDVPEHPSFVAFIRDIIALIKAHGSEICKVDAFFYQINKEYSPSVQDPQLQVAAMLSYGLRLSDGDPRVAHQLFFFLFNSFKLSLSKDKLRDEVKFLHKGMKNPGILAFIFGKMLPAIIRASFLESSAFPLGDVYGEALQVLLNHHVVPHELTESDLPHVLVTVKAFVNGLDQLGQNDGPLTGEQMHLLRQVLSMINELWPFLNVLSGSQTSSMIWEQTCQVLKYASAGIETAETYIGNVLDVADYSLNPSLLLSGLRRPTVDLTQVDTHIKSFTNNIISDVRKNWIVAGNKMTIQGVSSTQSGQGLDEPVWDLEELVEDLYERTIQWNDWYKKVFGGPLRPARYGMSVLF
ncbi:hypothetical protein QQX98_006436 [Neonectria punicea]|uniref:Orc1-like AAA ATPase domain-containing protein n=1 Tax=Neonectria punicea TaxID=979145 RepID=A0ABR1H1I2_9HYPO